jgi:hypothetical protein
VLRRRPVRLGNSGWPGSPARSVIQTRSTAWVGVVSGTARCLRPLARQRTLAPVPRVTSPQLSPVSSETRSPAGPFFLKYCRYFPYNAKLCCNGNEYAKAMAARAGIGFTALDNGFAAVDDAAAVQAICDSFDEEVIWGLAGFTATRRLLDAEKLSHDPAQPSRHPPDLRSGHHPDRDPRRGPATR